MKKKKIKSSWKEYFNFSARERRGAFFLACILLIQIIFLFYQRNLTKPLALPDAKIISSLLDLLNKNDSDSVLVSNNIDSVIIPKSYFNFDPNNLPDSSWLQLGISEKQIKVIKNYINHGGKFRIKNDFKKMYCISNNKYRELEFFILLPDSIHSVPKQPGKKANGSEFINLDISDSVNLIKLKGIGPVLASRIIKYRDKLGGFHSTEQIKEVWGINDSLYQSLISTIGIKNKIPFRFIHLNTDTFGILASHPYIKGKLAGLICNYRKQHQSFNSIEELKQLPLITEENFLKLAPYLMLE